MNYDVKAHSERSNKPEEKRLAEMEKVEWEKLFCEAKTKKPVQEF